MSTTRHGVRAAIARAMDRSSPRTSSDRARGALDFLGEDRVEMLARYDGQSLDELEVTFQLLPIGTRLALASVKALRLSDSGDPQYLVRAEPFAVELVTAAARRQARTSAPAARDMLQEELNGIAARKAALADAPFPVMDASPAAITAVTAALPDTNVLGVMHAKATATAISKERGIGVLNVHLDAGQDDPFEVAYDLGGRVDFPSAGETVEVEFAIAQAKKTWIVQRAPLTPALKKSVQEVPGVIYVRYEGTRTGGVAHFSVGDDANAVAQLTCLDGHRLIP